MGYSIAAPQQRPITSAFMVQYIAMILIILTVIAGVLTRRTVVGSAAQIPQTANDPLLVSSARPISDWSDFRPIPQAYLQCMSENEWTPFREVLSQHDLTLAIELFVPSLTVGFAEAENVRGQLLSTGMSSDAVLVSFAAQPFGSPSFMRHRWLKTLASSKVSDEF